jgi:hypothetical protein
MYRLSAVVAFMVAPSVALAQEAPVPISDVSVTVEIEAVDSNALDRWPEIGPDLTAAILAASAPYIADDGLSVAVVLNEVSLGGTTVLGEGGEFNRLGGWVYIRDDPAQPPIFSEEIEFEAETFALGGTSQFYIVPGRPDFYNALVNVFAARVVEEVAAAD